MKTLFSIFLLSINISLFSQVEKLAAVADTATLITPQYDLSKNATSITTTHEKDFNKGFITSPLELLIGKVAGLSISSLNGKPGSDYSINIHGISSFNGINTPLIIIDNIPQYYYPITLNPNDIETISVLKDGASTGMYQGAANGAIVINTKRGTANLKVNYSANLAISYLPKEVDVFSASEYRTLINNKMAGDPYAIGLLGNSNTNWQDEIYQKAFSQDHLLSVSGSTKRINMPYRISVGKTIQDGILKTSQFSRSTTAITLDPSFLNNYLKFNLNFRGTFNNNTIADESAIRNAVFFDPTQPVRNNSIYGGYYAWGIGNSLNSMAPYNPLALLNLKNSTEKIQHLSTNLSSEYKLHFLPDLSILASYASSSYSNDLNKVTDPSAPWLVRTLGTQTTNNKTIDNKYWEVNLRYAKHFDVLESKLNVNIGLSKNTIENTEAYKDNVYEDSKTYSTNYQTSRFVNGNFSIKDRYFATINARQDASTTTFSSDNRYIISYSGALAWNITNESFLKDNKIISELKLRISYGTSASQALYNTYFVNNLTPERNKTLNIGADYGFFANKITGSVEIYNKNGSDLVLPVWIANGANYSNMILQNIGEITSKGFDLSINANIISSSLCHWSVAGNLNYNKTEINKISLTNDPNDLGIRGGQAGIIGQSLTISSVGYAPNSFFVLQQVYGSNGMPIEGLFVDRSSQGGLVEGHLRNYYRDKSAAPDYTFGISSRLNYKKWEFSFSGRLSLNNYVYNGVSANSTYSLLSHNGFESNIPKFVTKTQFQNNNFLSDFYVENGSYFRMDYMSLGYQFDKLLHNKIGLNAAATVQNAFVITKYSGNDPEVVGGNDSFAYPRARTYSLKLNFSF